MNCGSLLGNVFFPREIRILFAYDYRALIGHSTSDPHEIALVTVAEYAMALLVASTPVQLSETCLNEQLSTKGQVRYRYFRLARKGLYYWPPTAFAIDLEG